jgi:hypothetical protein
MRLILNQDMGRGSFNDEEKTRLQDLVRLHGKNFKVIAKEMGRRPGKKLTYCEHVLDIIGLLFVLYFR